MLRIISFLLLLKRTSFDWIIKKIHGVRFIVANERNYNDYTILIEVQYSIIAHIL